MNSQFHVVLFETYRSDLSLQADEKQRSSLCWHLIDLAPKTFFRGGKKIHVDLHPTERPFVFVGTCSGGDEDLQFYISSVCDMLILSPCGPIMGNGTYSFYWCHRCYSVRPGGDGEKAVEEAIDMTLSAFKNKGQPSTWSTTYLGKIFTEREKQVGAKSKAVESGAPAQAKKAKNVD